MANTKLPARLLDTSAVPALNVTGDLTVDTTTLKVDSTNNRVGIGVASPDVLLDVGDSDHGSAGNVGIQIQNSQAFATVYDDTNSNTFAGIQTVNHDDTSNRTPTGLTFVHRSSSSGIASILSTSAASDRADIRFITRGSGGISEKMIIDDDGNVGIGTDNPDSKLHVHGVGALLSSDSYFVAQIQTDRNDDGSNDDGILQFVNGSSKTVKGEIRFDESTNTFELGHGDNQNHLVIASGGNVGIGNDDPDLPLTVTSNSGANAIAVRARSADDYGFIQFYNHAGSALRGQIFNHNGAMAISTDTTGTARLHIDTAGNVGFGGQTNPGTPIHVGISTSTGPRIQITHENSGGFGALDIDAYGSATLRLLSNWTASTMNGLPVQSFGLLTPHAYDIHIGTAGASRLRVKADGKVAVGNVNPYAQFTVYRSGTDPYSPTSFLDQPTMELKGDNHSGGYIGTRITNTSGNYEWFYGVNQDGSQSADFVLQGYNRSGTTYQEMARLHDAGIWSVPKQPHWFGSATNLTGAGLANAQTPHSSHSRNTINITTVSGALRWIIPRTGVYVISFNTISDSGSTRVDTIIMINGNNISKQLNATSTAGYRQRSATISVYVQENDYVQFSHEDWYNSNSNVFDNWRTISLTMVS